jgi:hypothetical protein
MKSQRKIFFLLSLFIFIFLDVIYAQEKNSGDTLAFKKISAGPQYRRSGWHQFLWGKNYRKEWYTPVSLPVFLLDKNNGGLKPDKEGGGHQTTSLHLETPTGENYSLRSVDKRLGKVLPENFKGTFIEHIANDQVSMSNPYAAVTVPGMEASAGIYHTTPKYVFLPTQDALDTFNNKFANKVYLFEERLKGDWSSSANLGNFDKFYTTEEVMKKMQEETEYRVDQAAFAKARLFDMFIGDWDRHEEQWGWGIVKKGDEKLFVPVPQDRDQAYFKHNGLLLDIAIYFAGIRYMQSFKFKVHNVTTMSYEERGLDRIFTNQLSLQDWLAVARDLEKSLTNKVIESSIKKLPREVFPISGNVIIRDLKLRRDHLLEYATKYYMFLAKEVEVVGTKGSEYFDVNCLANDVTTVNLFNKTKDGYKETKPFYSRTFRSGETNEIRLFGLSGKDVFTTEGKVNKGIKIVIIGGDKKDSFAINSSSNKKTILYDDADNYFVKETKTRRRISSDSDVHKYEYRTYIYDKRGFSPSLFYSDADRVFVGLGYRWQHHHWRKSPYVFDQIIGAHFSLSQKAMSYTYKGIFPNTIGKWSLELFANYDLVRWTNFYGLGDTTPLTTHDKEFNRMRTREAIGSVGISRKLGKNYFELNGFYQTIKIISDGNRYVAKNILPVDPEILNQKTFAGAQAGYSFVTLNDPIVPTKGITFSAKASYTQNVNQSSQSFWKYGGNLQIYLPLFSKFSLAISGGGATVSGNPEFYQYPSIGGGQDLRGFQRQRFYGKTAFYNSNELRFISKIKSYILNGKAGLVAFVDDGRVWMPNENTDKWHIGYGGGIVIAPFNLMFFDITYGFSDEDKVLELRLNVPL